MKYQGDISGSRERSQSSLSPPIGFDPGRKDFSVAERLRQARALIERGWVQCSFENTDGVCILGALNRTDGIRYGEPLRERAYQLLADGAGISGALMWWNDTPGRTKEEVLAAFDKAIAIAERGASPAAIWTAIDAYMVAEQVEA